MNLQPINTVADAILYLNARGMEVIWTLGGFIVREGGFGSEGNELTCDTVEQIVTFARSESENSRKLGHEQAFDSIAEPLRSVSESSATEDKASKDKSCEAGLTSRNEEAKEVTK